MDANPVRRSGKKKKKGLTASKSRGLQTAFCRSGERRFFGYAVDCDNLDRKFAVEILVDGYPAKVIRADACADELIKQGIGDGFYGFFCSLDDAILNESAVIEARLANVGTAVGAPIAVDRQSTATLSEPGTLRWLGGLRFSGQTSTRYETAKVLVDGTPITRVSATTWSHVGTSAEDARAVRAFDFHLPQTFADGKVHQLTLTDDTGESISGRPLAFLAFADGLRDAVAGRSVSEAELLRAELLDRLMPMSLPFSDYQKWRERLPPPSGSSSTLRGAVILVGAGATEDTLESLEQQSHGDWTAAALPPTDEPTGFNAEDARSFLADNAADCDFIVFTLAGTRFAPTALQQIADAFDQQEDAKAAYTDLELAGPDDSLWPLAFPVFDYERLLEQGYCAYLFALRRIAVERLFKTGASNLYRLFNSILDDSSLPRSGIIHIPEALGSLPAFNEAAAGTGLAAATRQHLRSRGVNGEVKPATGGSFPAVRVSRAPDRARVTIVIPTRNRRHLLEGCVESIRPAIKRRAAELLIIDNDSTEPDSIQYLAQLADGGAKVERVAGEFNFSRLNNRAAALARGEFLCLLNNDVKALDDGWLEEMLSRIHASDVGAVGALLVWPSKVVQHGGIVLGPAFMAAHAFGDRIDGDVGYGDLLRVAHECSAVTAACMVTRRDDFIEVGGMDEIRFPANFNDVDYCLKLRAMGKRIVFTPHAKLLRLDSASRGQNARADHKERFERELQNLRTKWGSVLAADPYYSPILSLDPIPYSALAWPIRALTPRINSPPVPLRAPVGF
jgi:GT2 family glycosyltransferase